MRRGLLAVVAVLATALLLASSLGLAQGQDPIARFNVNPTAGGLDTVFVANASSSRGPAPIVKYEWDWEGDGTFIEAGQEATHQYTEEGRYEIVLRVTDANNRTDDARRSVQVGEAAAQPAFEWDSLWDAMPTLLRGALITLQLAALSILLGLPLGILWGLARVSHFKVFSWPAAVYVTVIRGTPLLVQVLISFLIVRPYVNDTFGFEWDAFEAGLFAFVINTSAYQAEIIRAGIQAIPSGQMEAALGMGMTYRQAMRFVIVPQAFRLILPPLTNEFIVLIKDTSLVVAIGMTPPELLGSGRFIISRTQDILEIYVGVALVYLVLTFTLSRIIAHLEKRYRIPGLGIEAPGGLV
ncbi:MAG TPA: ABC transporter permease subunit [Candidatus Thermoplasmatota archaeon]|nr:ABC transporter permease subunit [Candidatus Thermoplasmatota archaeon]